MWGSRMRAGPHQVVRAKLVRLNVENHIASGWTDPPIDITLSTPGRERSHCRPFLA